MEMPCFVSRRKSFKALILQLYTNSQPTHD